MVPRIGETGRSFKGAGQYFLHDKQAQTSERVAFTQTNNIPTDDPHRAMDWMAWTALHQSELKHAAGVKASGGNCEKPVFHYSLAWHPDENPDESHMLECARETLSALGLSEHETVFVGHQDQAHPHVHIIANLVHPETGRTASVSHGQLKLSSWAERYELEHGVHCENRLMNQARRRQGEYTRHDEPVIDHKAQMQELWSQSDSFESFAAALDHAGYAVAAGDRRGVVVVDQSGKTHALSRQLDKEQRKQLKALLKDEAIHDGLASVENARAAQEQRQVELRAQQDREEVIEGQGDRLADEFDQAKSEQPEAEKIDPRAVTAAMDARHVFEMSRLAERLASQRQALADNMEAEFGPQQRAAKERMAELQVSLDQAKGLRGFWRSVTGRTRREQDMLADLQSEIAAMDARQREAETNYEQRRMRELAEIEDKQRKEREANELMIAEARRMGHVIEQDVSDAQKQDQGPSQAQS